MKRSFLLGICVTTILAASASAQQPDYYPLTGWRQPAYSPQTNWQPPAYYPLTGWQQPGGAQSWMVPVQQSAYYPQTSSMIVDMGGNYRLVARSPYYRPATSAWPTYSVGYSPAYNRTLSNPNYGPMASPYYPQVYYLSGYPVYRQPLR